MGAETRPLAGSTHAAGYCFAGGRREPELYGLPSDFCRERGRLTRLMPGGVPTGARKARRAGKAGKARKAGRAEAKGAFNTDKNG
ncbi:MAG: hypothetical protein GXY80_08835 [Syntrophorhabdus aromaticivorans]|uniref:Uncharacterized protein n=1 Tax=Syntrophorhabdus aromaticivorans TaxID=328301 RepID=A0A971S1S2_9BACT|nr:hypothetical protein [Syntrophorhabdus aromaticivorans]